jgi:hypothetical protein
LYRRLIGRNVRLQMGCPPVERRVDNEAEASSSTRRESVPGAERIDHNEET